MAKSLPDFDAGALIAATLEQDIGLKIRTNDPVAFKRKLYAFMAKNPAKKISILTGEEPTLFLLVKPTPAEATANAL